MHTINWIVIAEHSGQKLKVKKKIKSKAKKIVVD